MGFDNIVNISAEQGKGLGDLLEEIINNINYETFNFEETDITKIAIIGKPNVGKSSLVNRLLGEERMIVTDIAGTTRDATDTYYKNRDEKKWNNMISAGAQKNDHSILFMSIAVLHVGIPWLSDPTMAKVAILLKIGRAHV